MNVFIDFSKGKIEKVNPAPIYFGNNNVDKITLYFKNIDSDVEWFPALSASRADGNSIYPRLADANGTGIIIIDSVEYQYYQFTLSQSNGWNLVPGKTLFYVWVSYPDTNGNKCMGTFGCTILGTSGYYKVDNIVVNPELREYLENSFNQHINEVNNKFDELKEEFNDEYSKEINLQRGLINNLVGGEPRYVNTSSNILSLTSNKGVAVATDNGHWYYWNGTQYVDGGVYQATQIADGSIVYSKLDNGLKNAVSDTITFTSDDLIDNCKYSVLNTTKLFAITDTSASQGHYKQLVKKIIYIKGAAHIRMSSLSIAESYFLDENFSILSTVFNNYIGGNPIHFVDHSDGNVDFDVINDSWCYLAITQYNDHPDNSYITKYYCKDYDIINFEKQNNVKNQNFETIEKHKYKYSNGQLMLVYDPAYINNSYYYNASKNLVSIGKSKIIICNGLLTTDCYLLDENKKVIETIFTAISNGDVNFKDFGNGNVYIYVNISNVRYLALTYASDVLNIYITTNEFVDMTKQECIDYTDNSVANLKLSDKYRYVMSTFVGNSMKLDILGSNDLINWKNVYQNCYKPMSNDITLRDPAIAQIGDYYYIVYTGIDFRAGSYIGLCRTKDFINYEELTPLSFGDFNRVWAPEFFIDGLNVYIVASCQVGETIIFDPYIAKYNYLSHTLDTAVSLDLSNSGSNNIIDVNITKINKTYYAIAKDERSGHKDLFIMKSTNLFGTFELIYKDDGNVFGVAEGPALVMLDNGAFRLYFDNFEETSISNKISYSDSYDLINWSTKQSAVFEGSDLYAHCYIIDFNKIGVSSNGNLDILNMNKLPDNSLNGTYVLKATKTSIGITYEWVLEE